MSLPAAVIVNQAKGLLSANPTAQRVEISTRLLSSLIDRAEGGDDSEGLREHIADLKAEMGISINGTHVAAIQKAFRMSTQMARLTLALYQGAPRTMRKETLLRSLYEDNRTNWAGIKIIDVRICQLRDRLGRDAIHTVFGTGFAMMPSGTAQVAAALAGAGAA